MISLESDFKNVFLNINILEKFHDKYLDDVVFRLDFEFITPHKKYFYSSDRNLIVWKIAFDIFLKNLKLLHARKLNEVSLYPTEMYFKFDIERFETPDDDRMQWEVKFPSGVYYGPESAGYEESIIFFIDDNILKDFIDSLEIELMS